jgi:twitching motility protein PilU
MMNDNQIKEFDAHEGVQLRDRPQGIGRFRVSRLHQQGIRRAAFCVRSTTEIPTLHELSLPPILKDVVMTKRGMIIVVGATGSGKSTTLAAMIGHRNRKQPWAYHHDRGPDRVRPPSQGLHRHPA